jgi:FdrA protein
MSAEELQVRTGAYHDSVTLMQVSRVLGDRDGVQVAQVAMATELNVGLLAGLGFAIPERIGSGDLMIAVRADGPQELAAALAAVDSVLAGGSRPVSSGAGGSGGIGGRVAPRTIGAATRVDPQASLALISVPGQHAFTEAMDAVEAGLNVMVFSDNVSLEQEIRLKDAAAARGTLVMGPDCGTAVIGGVGLGFANVVQPGPVGIVAASGTGAQQMICLLDAAGVGISHCLGVGGRDLSEPVGGRSARQALALLDADPGTELIVVVSKPPAPAVAEQLAELAATLATPVRFALLGPGRDDLTAAAEGVVSALGARAPLGSWEQPRSWEPAVPTGPDAPPAARFSVLRGAFAGGTLCDEAMLIAAAELGPIASNIPLDGAPRLGPDLRVDGGHAMVDFGDDELTRGRPHPMIDGTLRAEWILRQEVGPHTEGIVLLLDVILGHGAHPDPSAELAPAIAAAHVAAFAAGTPLAVVVSLCGSSGDPQGVERQATTLARSGAAVYLSNAAAARAAVRLITGPPDHDSGVGDDD